MKSSNEGFSWDWINARRTPAVTDEDAFDLAPTEWKTWVKHGATGLYKVRRNRASSKLVMASEQMPEKGSVEDKILKQIYKYYEDSKHVFELLARRVA